MTTPTFREIIERELKMADRKRTIWAGKDIVQCSYWLGQSILAERLLRQFDKHVGEKNE